MTTVNFRKGLKGNLLALGIVGVVIGGSAYINYTQSNINNDNLANAPTLKAITQKVDNEIKNTTSDNLTLDDNSNDDSNSYSAADTKKSEPKVGMYWQDIKNTSWGEPEDKTTTKDKYGTTELWIYSGGRSLFFEDGVLESITQ